MKTLCLFLMICIFGQVYSQTVNCTTSFIESDWIQIGPFEYPDDNQMGRVTAIWVDPEDNNHILAGTRASSLWETTNGGDTWHNLISYHLPAIGVWDIVGFDEGAETSMYLSTMYWASDLNIYNLGLVYYDIDVDDWIQLEDYPIYGPLYDDKYDFKNESNLNLIGSRKLFIRPGTSELWVVNGQNVFKYDMDNKLWLTTLPVINLDDEGVSLDLNHQVNEVAFVPGVNNQAVSTVIDGTEGELFYTDEANAVSPTWLALSTPYSGLFTLGLDQYYEMTCTVSIPNTSNFYVYANFQVITDGVSAPDHYGRLYEYALPIAGAFTEPYLARYFDVPQNPNTNWGKLDNLVVLPEDPETFIIADASGPLFRGVIPGTASPIAIKYISSINPGTSAITTHTDVRDLQYRFNYGTTKHEIYIATDGGVSFCNDIDALIDNDFNNAGWNDLNGYGLTITEFLGFDNSELDKYLILAASPDGNTFVYGDQNVSTDPFFFNYASGDGYDGAISEIQFPKSVYNYNNSGSRDPSFFSLNNSKAYMTTGLGTLTVPKSLQSGCTDCINICPWNCQQHNFSMKPFDFEYNYNQEYFWTDTSDMFRETNPFNALNEWTPMSKTFITLKDVTGELSNPEIITYKPITAYKDFKIDSTTIGMYYSVKENRVIDTDPEIVGVNEMKLIRNTIDFEPIEDDYEAIDITPELNEAVSGYYNQIDHSIITDIEIDENNPDRLWIAFGFNTLGDENEQILRFILSNDHDAKNGRVYYSPDGGDTWQNFSNGLPNYPVLCLEYWQGTDNIIFAGTDVGVYVWNDAFGAWQCFDSEDKLPYCSVNELQINNCTNSLRACTYGYGLWETALPAIDASIDISTDITWSQTADIPHSIVIKPGATLTIVDCEIRMPEDGMIIIENGGKLIVDNATITNHCSFWKGIEVWGKGNAVSHPALADIISGEYPVSDSDHGVVYLKNNAKIESAEVAITTYNSTNPTMSSHYGGIIVAHDAEFHNNITSIVMHPFDVLPSNTDDDNISEFLMCRFKKDDQMPCETYASSDVFLDDVDGVVFHACIFENTFSSCTDFDFPVGISSTNATYTVESDCNFMAEEGCETYATYFSGYYRGIYASNSTPKPRPITIDDVHFMNNERAILLSAVTQSEIFRNYFEVPDFAAKTAYGLYLEGCLNYHVEGNYFTSLGELTANANYCSGIFVKNNHNVATEVYRNTFEDIEIGIRSQGNNSKLQLRCNEFIGPIYDYNIIVTSGILGNQGICNAIITQPAGNKFSLSGEPESDFRIVPVELTLSYRHHTESDYIPIDFTASNINLHDCGVSGSEDCESTLPGGTGGEVRMMSVTVDYQEAIDFELSKIDGGNTAELIADIEGGQSPTELKYSLDEASPYISNDALVTLIEIEPLGTPDILDIMNNNYPITDTVATALDLSNYEVPPSIIESLNEDVINNQLTVSAMTDLLATVSILETKREYAILQSLNYLIKENEVDSALSLIDEEAGDWAQQWEIQLLSATSRFTDVAAALADYAVYDKTGEDFKTLYSLILAIDSSGRLIDEISEAEETALRTIASKETPSGIASQNILSYINREESFPELIDDIPEHEFRIQHELTTDNTSVFNVHPNPADDLVYIEIMNAFEGNYELCIYNIMGLKVFETELNKEYYWIEITNLTPGLYFFDLLYGEKSIGIEKVVKN